MKNLLPLLLCLFYFKSVAQSQPTVSEKSALLPSVLLNGRFYIKIPVANGDSILSFCDTGGGYTAIYASTINAVHLETKVLEITIDGEKVKYIPAASVISSPTIPAPHIQRYYQPYIKVPFYIVPDDSKETDYFAKYVPHQAFLGQFFFIDHAWTFDYLHGKLYVNTPLAAGAAGENIQPVGFKKDKDGNKIFGHPRIKIEIDGQVIDVLFDTGASIILSKNTQTAVQSRGASIGGSFMAKSIFDDLHAKHPDWRFIEKGEVTGADMMQVPLVKVGSLTAGPVWFAKRPDEAWSRGMIGSMDKVVKGAVGGSFFQYFKIVIDYNSELVKFEK